MVANKEHLLHHLFKLTFFLPKIESEMNICQIVGSGKCYDQNGGMMSNFDKICHFVV